VPRLLRMCGISGVVSASGSLDPERVAARSTVLVLWHERHVEREPGGVRVPELLAER
jgi:hypothetical protein